MDLVPSSESIWRWGPTVPVSPFSIQPLLFLDELIIISPQFASDLKLDAVLSAMDSHLGSTDVQFTGCRLLKVADDAALTGAVAVECLERVCNAMRVYLGSAKVQWCGCGVLLHLSQAATNRPLIHASDSVTLVFMALGTHYSDGRYSTLIEVSLSVLHVLAEDADKRSLQVMSSGVHHLLSFLAACPTLPVIVRQICKVLAILSRSPDTAARIVSTGGLELLHTVLEEKYCLSDESVQEAGCNVLKSLASHGDSDIAHALVSPRGLKFLYTVMQVHSDSEAVQGVAVGLLLELTASAAALARLKVGGHAIAALQRAKATHVDAAAIVTVADLAMQALR